MVSLLLRMRMDSIQTSRRLLLVAALFFVTVLFYYSYTYMVPNRQPGNNKIVSSQFLKSNENHQLLTDDVTIVTSYINIGSFQKGAGNVIFKPKLYHNWMASFNMITNPVIAFFESEQDINKFKSIRKTMPPNMTKVVKILRNNTWAFSLRPWIELIFSQPSYPKHHPNTVLPDYSCVMHSKYDFINMALKENPFNTKYFAWIDIGYFRDLVHKYKQPVRIHLPPKFDHHTVGYGVVHPWSSRPLSAKEIVQGNHVWVAGGYFVARYDVMQRWTNQYKAFTEKMLQEKWMSTDQQALYYMFQPQHNQSALMDVHIQTYKSDGNGNPWFYIGYISTKPFTRGKGGKVIL